MYISFCTPCMNRLDFLKRTIYPNLELLKKFNEKYNGIHKFELSLCNYDSKDELDDFINIDLKHHLDSGILIYTKVGNKEFFNACHSKNIAHRYSNGDVLVNLDGDNFITEKFVEYIIEIFSKNMNVITHGHRLSYGIVCISRENFYKLGGYSELFNSYGNDDPDLIERSKFLGCEVLGISEDMVTTIYHDEDMRIKNFKYKYDVDTSDKLNRDIMKFYLDNKIINPNEYNNIEFGKL